MQPSNLFIKNVKVTNFKSFNETELDLDKFNVVIGSNASGKSNFTQIFNFLKNISDHGLDNAISLQGGVEHLTNIAVGSSKDLSIEITFGSFSRYGNSIHFRRRPFNGLIDEINYKFSLKFSRGGRYKISEDRLKLHVTIPQKDPGDRPDGTITIANVKGNLKSEVNFPSDLEIKDSDFMPRYVIREKIRTKELLINSYHLYSIIPSWMSLTDSFSIYDFDPKLPKKAVPITGKSELESDGSNIALVLKDVMRSSDTKRKFLNLVKELLPFIDTLNIERFSDKSLLFKIKEKYFDNHFIPSSLLSDGTISITSLILALYFEENELTIIEEPERNIHPSLLENLIEMMKDASRDKQIIITTHNPEVVNHAGLENIITILRDDQGFSKIERPQNREKILQFLENEMPLSDLYVDNILTK